MNHTKWHKHELDLYSIQNYKQKTTVTAFRPFSACNMQHKTIQHTTPKSLYSEIKTWRSVDK